MRRVIRFCCRCAPDRGHAPTKDLWRRQNLCRTQNLWERGLSRDRRRSRREPGLCGLPDAPRHPILLPLRARSRASALLQGIRGVARFCVERTSRGSVACPAIGDAVVVNPGYAVCLMHRVTRFCCRCAPDRGQATLLQGIRGVARIGVKRRTCGPACSRRRDAELVGVSLLAIGDAVVVNSGYAVCLMRRVIRFCCRCAPDRIAHAGIRKRVPYNASINPLRRLTLRRKASSKTP